MISLATIKFASAHNLTINSIPKDNWKRGMFRSRKLLMKINIMNNIKSKLKFNNSALTNSKIDKHSN